MNAKEAHTVYGWEDVTKKLEAFNVYLKEIMVQLIERLTNSRIDYEPLSKKDTEGIEKGLGDIKMLSVNDANTTGSLEDDIKASTQIFKRHLTYLAMHHAPFFG